MLRHLLISVKDQTGIVELRRSIDGILAAEYMGLD